MALVDKAPEPGVGGRLGGGISQHLPPPAGITGIPPVGAGPPVPPATETLAALGTRASGRRPRAGRTRAARIRGRAPGGRHPNTAREGPLNGRVAQPRNGVDRLSTPHRVAAAPAARVRVPPVAVRVTRPAVLGRSLPEVEVATPEMSATVGEALRLRPR
jgi:hypothetical protein